MVAHQAVSHDADLAEALIKTHEVQEANFLVVTKDETPVHHPRYAVVVSSREMGRGLEARETHDKMLN